MLRAAEIVTEQKNTEKRNTILRLRAHSNAPPFIDSLSSAQIKHSKIRIGKNMSSRTIESIPDKKTLVLRLKSYGDTTLKADAQHADRVTSQCDRDPSDEDGRASSMAFDRAASTAFDRASSMAYSRESSNEDGRASSTAFDRSSSMAYSRESSDEDGRAYSAACDREFSDEEHSYARTSSECIDKLTKAQKIQNRIVDIHAGFSSWKLKHSRLLTDDDAEHIGFFGVVELTRNLRPDYPIIHYGGQFMTEGEIKGIRLSQVLNAAVASNSARPENRWYSPAFPAGGHNTAACALDSEYSDSVPDELALLNNILDSDRTPDAVDFFLQQYLGELAGEAIPDRASLTRKEFKVRVAEEIAKRNALLSSLLAKVIVPLLCRFKSRSRGCVFPIGIFYDFLLKIKYAKEAMMYGSTQGNSNIFTEDEKVQHENFREIMIESAVAYAEEASDEYEGGWSVYEKDMMLRGFMAAPDGLTHAQKFNLYEYRESLLDELHAVLELIQTEVKNVLPKNKGRSA